VTLLLLFLLLDETAAERELARIRAEFTVRGKSESVAALERLARAAPSTEAGGQAAVWCGEMSQLGGDLDGAAIWFAHARANAPPGGEAHRLALRGEGDVLLARRHWLDARARYEAAANGAGGVLAEELAQKRALATRLLHRGAVEYAAWALVAFIGLAFVVRAARGRGPWRPPLELLYVLPVYALFLAGAIGRDPQVLRALAVCALGSLALIAASGLAARRAPPPPWLHALALVAANLALFYAVLNRTGLVDTLIFTVQM
jgi:hypothetical protein